MTINQLDKVFTMNYSIRHEICPNIAAIALAELVGAKWFRDGSRVLIECSDCIAEIYWTTQSKHIMAIREAKCID